MYRKDKIAVAVDNYKRKYSDDEKDDNLNNSDDGKEIDSEPSSNNEENKVLVKNNEIESVTHADKISNLVEKSQVEGFNMFLDKIKPTNKKNNTISEISKMKSFEVIDPKKKYFPPSQFTVTSINQAHDLLKVDNMEVQASSELSSEKWLKAHNLDALKLTIEHLISKGKLGKPRPDQESGKAINCLVYDELDITDFEYKLHMAIELYSKRIKWLLQGSRKLFGLINGSKIGVLIDSSDANLGFGRATSLQENLLHLLDEQLYKKKSINIGFFGTNNKFLWTNFMDLNCRVVEEIKEALVNIVPMGGCNLMQAIKQIVQDKTLDQVVLILGSSPDQETNLLLDFIQQLLLGKNLPFHCVAFESLTEDVNIISKKIASISNGNYHRYSSLSEELIYTSNDIDSLLIEIERCQNVLSNVDLMRKGQFTNQFNPIINQIAEELKQMPQFESLPKPLSFDDPLSFEISKFEPSTSSDWLSTNGLKAKKRSLYSILNPNSYQNRSEYIPSIGRLVTSSVYEKAMIQVEWSDGTTRNVHADLAQLYEYQKVLGEQVKLLEQRINWLVTGSRRIFGTIIERKVVFIVDFSISNLKYLVHILQSLKLLIQQQIISKDKFNIIAFSSTLSAFKPHLFEVNKKNLEEAWSWLKTLSCSGSRNFLGALKLVLENPADTQHNDLPHGIYLFTSGVPDQQIEPLLAYLEERLLGTRTKIHTVLFNVDDYDISGAPIPSRYANITKTAEIMRLIAHNTKGRFHWFRESGIIESDDIRILMTEIDLAVEYSRRTQQIIKDFKEKYPDSHLKRAEKERMRLDEQICRRDSSDNMIALLPPRQTSLSKARMRYLSSKTEESSKIPKTLAYRTSIDPRKSVANSRPFKQSIQSAFYTEDKNSKGVVYKDISDQIIKPRKGIGKTVIPDKEEWVSSRDWMKKYSLKNMGLDLLRLVSGTECKHEEVLVVPLEKYVEAKYCTGLFPIVNVKGTRKHLQYTTTELNKYSTEAKNALIRYLKRLEWLLISSKRIFGVIIESEITILLDTSGSMTVHMPELILNLKTLIWEQIFKRKINYNIIAFNSQICRFREKLVVPDETNCHSAIGWTEHLAACGSTDTLKAIQVTLDDPRVQAIYLLSDGKPDSSTEVVLKSVQNLISEKKKNIVIHTISFNCEDDSANDFLKRMAKMTGGRYHKVCHDYDVRMFTQRIMQNCIEQNVCNKDNETMGDRTSIAANVLSIDPHYPPLPLLEGDDLIRITKEIQVTRENLSKINYFHQLHIQLKKYQEIQKLAKLEIPTN